MIIRAKWPGGFYDGYSKVEHRDECELWICVHWHQGKCVEEHLGTLQTIPHYPGSQMRWFVLIVPIRMNDGLI